MSHSGEEPLINAVKHDSGAISLRDLSNLIQKGVFRGKVGGWVSKVAMASHSRVNRSVNMDRSKSSKLQNRETSFWKVAIAARGTWWSYFFPGLGLLSSHTHFSHELGFIWVTGEVKRAHPGLHKFMVRFTYFAALSFSRRSVGRSIRRFFLRGRRVNFTTI